MAEKVKLSKDGSSIDFVQTDSIPTSVKKFRQSPEIEGFYRFIYENDLQKEAFQILERIVNERKSRKKLEKVEAAAIAQAAKKAESAAKADAAKKTVPIKVAASAKVPAVKKAAVVAKPSAKAQPKKLAPVAKKATPAKKAAPSAKKKSGKKK